MCKQAWHGYLMTDRPGERSKHRPPNRSGVAAEDLIALQAACRTLVAISAQAMTAVADDVDLAQFRALVVIEAKGSVSLGELSEATNQHLSTTSRMCDRLVAAELVHRQDDPADRRQLRLTLTQHGQKIVDTVVQQREQRLEPMLAAMPTARRKELVRSLVEFVALGPTPLEADLWALGWAT